MYTVSTLGRKTGIKQYTRWSFRSLASTIVASPITSDKVLREIARTIKEEMKSLASMEHDTILRDRYDHVELFQEPAAAATSPPAAQRWQIATVIQHLHILHPSVLYLTGKECPHLVRAAKLGVVMQIMSQLVVMTLLTKSQLNQSTSIPLVTNPRDSPHQKVLNGVGSRLLATMWTKMFVHYCND